MSDLGVELRQYPEWDRGELTAHDMIAACHSCPLPTQDWYDHAARVVLELAATDELAAAAYLSGVLNVYEAERTHRSAPAGSASTQDPSGTMAVD